MISARDAAEWARELGISREAVELYLECEVIDLHLDTFIWSRVFGYDPGVRNRAGPFGWFFGHADVPRLREAAVSGATWVVTTNPLRDGPDRFAALLRNLEQLAATLARFPDDIALVRTLAEYRAARAGGKHAALVGLQGGNALDGVDDAVERLPRDLVSRVTLVHLSNSRLGSTSSPLRLGPDAGLGRAGIELLQRLEHARILVDLAHVGPEGFWDAVEAHDRARPLVVTHTGVSGVHRHWRNIEDAQIRAIAETGGVVGVMFHASYLGDAFFRGRAERIVEHLEHIVRTAGEDTPALGSDFDGLIIPPRDLGSVLELPRLVESMLRRRWTPERIRKILGENFLRVLGEVRP